MFDALAEKEPSWDWYCFDSPSVCRRVNGAAIVQRHRAQSPDGIVDPAWHHLNLGGGIELYWGRPDSPGIVVNGIIVQGHYSVPPTLWQGEDRFIGYPQLAFLDYGGRLPLNLTRTELDLDRLPLKESLLKAVLRDFLAYFLIAAPHSVSWGPSMPRRYSEMNRVSYDQSSFLLWMLTEHGSSLLDPWHFKELSIRRLIILPASLKTLRAKVEWDGSCIAILRDYHSPHILESDLLKVGGTRRFDIPVNGARVLAQRPVREMWDAMPLGFWPPRKEDSPEQKGVVEEWSSGDWVLLKHGNCPDEAFDFRGVIAKVPDDRAKLCPILAAEWYLGAPPEVMSPPAQAWHQLLHTPYIPFKEKERLSMMREAFERLGPEIALWRHTIPNHHGALGRRTGR